MTAPAPHATLQAEFDAATDAYESGRCADAEPIFARLSVDPRVKPGTLPAAMIALRRALCRQGDADFGQVDRSIRDALPVVEAAGPAMVADVRAGWVRIGQIAAYRFDHDGAVAAYRHALALPGGDAALNAVAGLAMVTAFDGDGTALTTLDHALAVAAGAKPDAATRRQQGYLLAIRTRVLMNLGRYADADKDAQKALSLAGGLTTRISLSDASLRADAAQAAILNNRDDAARELLAYTGAGRIADSPFATATVMNVPDCDDSVGLRTGDNAVVEFSIGNNGRVADAQTVFTRGNFQTARAYAAAVRGWAWQPETVAKLPPFYRALVRVELRCSKGSSGVPGIMAPFDHRILQWAAPFAGVANLDHGSVNLGTLRRRAADLETQGDRTGAGTVLLAALALDPVVSATASADAEHVVGLLADSDAVHRASALVMRVLVLVEAARVKAKIAQGEYPDAAPVMLAAAHLPAIAADALAQDTLLMTSATQHMQRRFSDREMALLQQIADDTRLESGSPLRQIALLRLASRAASEGRHADADALFTRTGLGEQQCALIGDIPRMRAAGSDDDFPLEAMRYGFDGWAKVEYDITANGHTNDPRVVIAYPPFVFVEGATAMARNFRYDTSFRPSGKLACSAKTETIDFKIRR